MKIQAQVPTIIYIACYGLYGEIYGRTSGELQGYNEYLQSIAEYIKPLLSNPSIYRPLIIVVCGGKTNPQFSDVSESETVCDKLIFLLEQEGIRNKSKCCLVLDFESLSTVQNIFLGIRNASAFCRSQAYHDLTDYQHFFVFDSLRAMQAKPVVNYFCKSFGIQNWQVIGFNRQDTHPNSKWHKQFAKSLLYRIPLLGKFLIERELKKKRTL